MSDLDLTLQIEAAARGRALPRLGRRHVAVRRDAHVLTLVALAGEDTDVHIALFGPIGSEPVLAFVPDPRHRGDLFRMYRGLLAHIESYFSACLKAEAYPQLWVSSTAAARHVDALASRLRNARADADIRRLGELLSYPADRFHVPGQQVLCAATAALKLHFATGQQPSEDEHLGAVLSWISPEWVDPGPGADVFESAEAAKLVPMSIHTDPNFDAELLVPLLRAYNRERKGPGRTVELDRLSREIRDLVWLVAQAVHHATEQAASVLAGSDLPPLPALADLERAESASFADFMASREAGYRVPNRDSRKRAAFGLEEREVCLENYEAAAVLQDPVHRLRAQLEGRVFAGTVRSSTRVRVAPRTFRHHLEVETDQRALRLRPRDELYWADDPRLVVVVRLVRRRKGVAVVDLATLRGERAAGVPAVGAPASFVPGVPDWSRLARSRGQLRGRLDDAANAAATGTPAPSKSTPAEDPIVALGRLT